jgi:tetratricopeptide (TPR) repeat protein
MFKRLSVTALGSCRIVNPMRNAAQAGLIDLANADVYGYLHTVREVLQFLDFRDGLALPPEIVPYLAGPRGLPTRAKPEETCVYLVEISSLKSVMLGEWVLQLNYFTERFRGHPNLLKVLYAELGEDQRDRRILDLAAHADFAALAPFERHVLAESHVATTTRETLERDVLEIVARLPRPVVFVTHCNLVDTQGREIESRARISTWMAELARSHGMRVFDPTPHVLAFGVEAAMAEGGASRAHYAPAFEAILQEELLHEVRLAAASLPRTTHGFVPESPMPVLRRAMPAPAEPGAAPMHLRAAAAMRAGDLDAAAAVARSAIAADPPCAPGISVIAQVALRRGEPETALDFALRGRAANPRNSSSVVTAAKALTKLKRFEEAAVMWREMAGCRREATWPLIEAARCHLRAKQADAGLALADEVLEREPADTVALAVKAEALRLLGRYAELAAVAEALAEANPEAALAIMQWMIAAGRVEGLTRVARRVCAAPQGVPEAHRDDICRQLKAAGEHALAQEFWATGAEALRAYLVFHPGDRTVARTLAKLTTHWLKPARSAVQAGDLRAAAQAYDLVLHIDPEGVKILREAASAAEKRADWTRAADLWDQVERAGDSDAATLVRAARAADLAGRPEPALGFYRRAARADPANAKALASAESLSRRLAKQARAQEAAGDIDGAVRAAAIVLADNPQDPICTRLLRRGGAQVASALRQAVAEGDDVRQEALATQLLRIDPERFEALRVLSKARLTSGRFDEAAHLLRRLTVVQSDVAAHWIKLGRCLRLMKSYDEARDAARQALARDPTSLAAHKILADLGERRAR